MPWITEDFQCLCWALSACAHFSPQPFAEGKALCKNTPHQRAPLIMPCPLNVYTVQREIKQKLIPKYLHKLCVFPRGCSWSSPVLLCQGVPYAWPALWNMEQVLPQASAGMTLHFQMHLFGSQSKYWNHRVLFWLLPVFCKSFTRYWYEWKTAQSTYIVLQEKYFWFYDTKTFCLLFEGFFFS